MLTPFLFCVHGFFIGAGHTKFVAWEGVLGAFGVRIPVSWMMSKRQPTSMFRVGLGIPCSTTIQLIIDLLYFNHCRKHPESLKPLED